MLLVLWVVLLVVNLFELAINHSLLSHTSSMSVGLSGFYHRKLTQCPYAKQEPGLEYLSLPDKQKSEFSDRNVSNSESCIKSHAISIGLSG